VRDVLSPQLLAVSQQQAGVFSSEQAYEHGHNQRQIQRLRGSYLVSVRRGVYAVRAEYASATPDQQHAMRVAALALKLEAPAVLSHQTAAQELSIPLLAPDLSLLHVTALPGSAVGTKPASSTTSPSCRKTRSVRVTVRCRSHRSREPPSTSG
jgi:hypothetical protein